MIRSFFLGTKNEWNTERMLITSMTPKGCNFFDVRGQSIMCTCASLLCFSAQFTKTISRNHLCIKVGEDFDGWYNLSLMGKKNNIVFHPRLFFYHLSIYVDKVKGGCLIPSVRHLRTRPILDFAKLEWGPSMHDKLQGFSTVSSSHSLAYTEFQMRKISDDVESIFYRRLPFTWRESSFKNISVKLVQESLSLYRTLLM